MPYRILVPALFATFLTFAAPVPASAQLFDVGGAVQRAQMIANQIVQIANQVRQVQSMARQLSELEDQLDHMERAARGQIDALVEPFADLAAEPVGLVRDGLAWSSDFAGTADDVTGAVRDFGRGGSFTRIWRTALGTADRVGEADILDLYRDLPPQAATRAAEDFRRAREAAGRQGALDYATLDAAAALAATVESSQASFADLTANNNLSATALQQASVAAALSRGRISAAMSQVLAYEAVQEANRRRQAELARLEQLAKWHESRQRAGAMAETMRDAATQSRADLRDGLLLQVPSFYGGN
ncbi:MAG: hypothetical protein OXI46_07220 [Gemmatimonadota bacterium]|nr:hypothetical protein [Gemmatimonadota bacterium]